MEGEGCRVDLWLWRARFCKTRALASRLVDSGRIRINRGGRQGRVDKPSRTVRPGDELIFAIGARLVAIRVEGLGERRGPPAEARGLYSALELDPAALADAQGQEEVVAGDEAAPAVRRVTAKSPG
jgi:ribosomal 50S subunit-recycling heat shock protein